MWKNKRLWSVCMAMILLLTLAAGCTTAQPSTDPTNNTTPAQAQSKEPETPPPASSNFNETGYPIVNEPVTLHLMSTSNANHGPFDEMVLFDVMEELTNVRLEFTTIDTAAWDEQKNLAFVGDDLPDVFFTGITTKDEVLYGTQGKVLLDLTPYIESYMPNYKKTMEEYPGVKPATTAMDGSIYSLAYVVDTLTVAGYTNYVRGDFLAQVGLERPKTVDEFYEMLKAFQGIGSDIVPMSYTNVDTMFGTFINAFGDSADIEWTADASGKVQYVPVSEQYKRTLEFFNKLYSEKLMDNEIFTQTSDQASGKILDNKVGCTNYGTPLTAANYASGEIETIMLAPLTSEYSDTPKILGYNAFTSGKGAVTTKCEYPEVWTRWIDIFFSDEDVAPGLNCISMWLGIRGEHWDFTDDAKTLYTRMKPADTELSEELWTNRYVTPGSGIGPCKLVFDAIPDNNPSQYMKASQSVENFFPYQQVPFPTTYLRYTDEELNEIGTIETDITEFIKTARAEFVSGVRSINDFDKYVAELEKMGLEKLIGMKQIAYDRYMVAAK